MKLIEVKAKFGPRKKTKLRLKKTKREGKTTKTSSRLNHITIMGSMTTLVKHNFAQPIEFGFFGNEYAVVKCSYI